MWYIVTGHDKPSWRRTFYFVGIFSMTIPENRRSVGVSSHCIGSMAKSGAQQAEIQNAQWFPLLRIHASCNLWITHRYQMKQIQIKLTDEEHTGTIYQPVCQNAAATASADTLMKAHPEWKDVPRRKIQDRTCNPFHGTFVKKWKSIYTSTFKQNAKRRSKPRHYTLPWQFLRS